MKITGKAPQGKRTQKECSPKQKESKKPGLTVAFEIKGDELDFIGIVERDANGQ
jgi:hypothetical protein